MAHDVSLTRFTEAANFLVLKRVKNLNSKSGNFQIDEIQESAIFDRAPRTLTLFFVE